MAEHFGAEKPLVHTEWGWEAMRGAAVFYERSFDRLLELVEQGKVAGHMFWSWQDIREYSRVDWATVDGVLLSGVVTEGREPRERLYVELARLFQQRRHEEAPATTRPEAVPLRFHTWSPGSAFRPIALQSLAEAEPARKAWAELEARMAKHWSQSWITRSQWQRTGERLRLWRGGRVEIAGVPFECAVVDGYARPLVLTPEVPEMEIALGGRCTRLHILGNVTLPTGFPVTGKPGDRVATFTLERPGARAQEVPIRAGFEAARANLIHEATRIDPVASAAPRALIFFKDPVRERYQVLLYSVPVRGPASSLRVRLAPGAEPLAIFAITAERAAGGQA
jgi:hypothetical protein